MQDGVRRERLFAAAQNDGVAALHAQTCCVNGDIGPRFVNEEDDAERHADFVNLQPIRSDVAIEHAPDRVWQRDDFAQALRRRADAFGRQTQAINVSGG